MGEEFELAWVYAVRVAASLRIGITGARGIIGRQVIEVSHQFPGAKIYPYDGDIRAYAHAKRWAQKVKPDIVIHLAAIVSTAAARGDKTLAKEVNEMGPSTFARAVLDGMEGRPVRFLYTSTSHVYESNEAPISENGLLRPQNFYAETKLAGESTLKNLASEEQKLSLIIARVFSIYSELQTPSFLFPSLMKKITPGLPAQQIELPGWNNVRDFLHAKQAAALLLLLSRSPARGVVNVGSGKPRTIKAFAEGMFGVQLGVRQQDADSAPSTLVADTSLLTEAIGLTRFDEIVSGS